MLTKDLVKKLSPEQQEILAQMEFRKTQQRLKLLELARGNDWQSRYAPVFIFAVFLIFITFYYCDCFHVQGKPEVLLLFLGMGLVFSVIGYLARMNRRLDALLELLDFDREHSKNETNA